MAADVVIPVPDSGVPAALGYAEEAGIPFDTGLIRNHYVGRTFIEPQQAIRHFGVKIKLNAIRRSGFLTNTEEARKKGSLRKRNPRFTPPCSLYVEITCS